MSHDRLTRALEELEVPDATEARERTIATARSAAAGSKSTGPVRRASARRVLSVGLALALLVGGLLTPAGRAASGWVGELVGIGEVGGEPTLEKRGFQSREKEAVVIDNGRAPDGSGYEWVAYECRVDLRDEGLPNVFNGFGISLEWVKGRRAAGGTGGSCEQAESDHPRPRVFRGSGVHIVPPQFRGVDEPDLVVSGETGPAVHRVKVIYTAANGETSQRPVDFTRARPELLRRVGLKEQIGTYVAFIPGAWAARDEVEERLDLRALETTGKLKLGPVARRERRMIRRAHRVCRSTEPPPSALLDPSDKPSHRRLRAMERAYAPVRACLAREAPPSPVEVIAYDATGKEVGRHREPVAVQASSLPNLEPERVPEGARRRRRPSDPRAVGKPTVLIAGRAPEGAHYELFVEHFADRRGKPYGHCETLWWPRMAAGTAGGGFCGPGLPPSSAFGRRPEGVYAKPFGFLGVAAPATRRLLLQGFARAQVRRVRVIYKARGGGWNDAPVKLVRVAGRLRRRVRADRDFGYFVAFVPASVARRHYGGIPPRRADGAAAIQVIAYGRGGRELGRVKHRN